MVVLRAARILLGKRRQAVLLCAQTVQLRAPRQLGGQQQQYGRRQRRAAKEHKTVLPRAVDGCARAGDVVQLRVAEVKGGERRALTEQPLRAVVGLRHFDGDIQQRRERRGKPRLLRLTAGKHGARQAGAAGHGGEVVEHDARLIEVVLLGIAPLQQALQLHLPVVNEGQQQQLALGVDIEADAVVRIRGGLRVLWQGKVRVHGGGVAVTAEIDGGNAQPHAVGKGVVAVEHRARDCPELHAQMTRVLARLNAHALPRKLILARVDGEILVHVRQQHLTEALLLFDRGDGDALADDLRGAERKNHLTAAAEQPLPQNRLHRVPQGVQPHELTVLDRVRRRGQDDPLGNGVAAQRHLGDADLPLGDLHHQRPAAQLLLAHKCSLPDCGNGTAVPKNGSAPPTGSCFSLAGRSAPALFSPVLQPKKTEVRRDEPVAP